MRHTRLVSAIVAASVIAAGVSAGTAWAGGPGGVVENVDDMSAAVGTGVFEDDLVGFVAYGATNEEAAAKVIAQCQAAGGLECTSDEETNDDLCIVSAADPVTSVVSGGAGLTIPEALQNAVQNATANSMPISAADAVVVISDCSWDE